MTPDRPPTRAERLQQQIDALTGTRQQTVDHPESPRQMTDRAAREAREFEDDSDEPQMPETD